MKVWKLVIVLLAVGMFSVSAVAQDTCATAVAPGGPVNLCTMSVGLTDDEGDGGYDDCWGGYGQRDGWYSFVATDTVHRLRTDLNSVETDTHFEVYSGACGAQTEIACSEDEVPAGWYGDICVGGLTVSETYYVQLGTYAVDHDTYGPSYNWCNYYTSLTFQLDVELDPGKTCGDGVVSCAPGTAEECDGADIGSCITGTICDGDCTCPDPICGNNIIEAGEDCDGTEDSACPALCSGCACPSAPALPIWGIVGLGVLLAGGGATAVARRRKKA